MTSLPDRSVRQNYMPVSGNGNWRRAARIGVDARFFLFKDIGMSLRFTLLGASLIFASACSSSADSADKAAAAKTSPQAAPQTSAAAMPAAAAPSAVPSVAPAAASAAPAAPIVVAQAGPAVTAASSAGATATGSAASDNGKLYTVVDKTKVDPNTLMGWKTWRAQACERCHGANQEGLVGPSLVNSLKVLTKDEFVTTLKNGRIEKGMPNFGGVPGVVNNLDNLYAYLKGRSDGAIGPGHLYPIEK
jgi:mono/diheme cytochrome c family protein